MLDLCRYMSAQGHSVAVVSRGIGAVDAPFRAAGFTPGRLPLGGLFDFISPVRLARVLDRVEAPPWCTCIISKTRARPCGRAGSWPTALKYA